MPELPDVEVYVERLAATLVGERLGRVRLASPFVLRSYDPPLSAVEGLRVTGFRRLGKRIVFEFEDDLFLVLHLMIAGRLRWRGPGATLQRKVGLLAFDFDAGSLILTEAATRKRASLYCVRGEQSLQVFDRGGVEPLEIDLATFSEALTRENRTLKRGLTDPRLFSGIGNAYSDELLFDAGLSPVKRTRQLSTEEIERLYHSTQKILAHWLETLRDEVGDGFPDKVTAFREDMFVHGRFKKPCRVCETPIQRIRHQSNEMNYCPHCQTGGKLLADRSLSRLLKSDWPKSLEELDELKAEAREQLAGMARPSATPVTKNKKAPVSKKKTSKKKKATRSE